MKAREHTPRLSVVDVLVSKIMIWEPDSKTTVGPAPKDCWILRECESIEINETYKKLFGTAILRLPRGTVIQKTITAQNSKENENTVYVERMDDGLVVERRGKTELATPEHFHVGQRISIFLGYYHDDGSKRFKSESERRQEMEKSLSSVPFFDGYITKCSITTPIEVHCEDLASVLKNISCKHLPPSKNDVEINKILNDEQGSLNLLKNTGIRLHPATIESHINIGKIEIPQGWTVADLLSNWSNYHLYCFIRTEKGVPYLKVGRSYFSTKTAESIVNNDQSEKGCFIQFDYDVAEDKLSFMHTDPRFLAVEAQCYLPDKKFYRVTLRINEKWEGKSDTKNDKFELLNEVTISKKDMKTGAVSQTNTKSKVDLSTYHIVPFFPRRVGITPQELIEEAKAFFNSYNTNGIEGTLTIFGDYQLRSGDKVELCDIIHPEKNGWYLIDEVTTKFGVNGFRQILKIPYCIAKPEPDKNDKKK